jgi:hypothetical protein
MGLLCERIMNHESLLIDKQEGKEIGNAKREENRWICFP